MAIAAAAFASGVTLRGVWPRKAGADLPPPEEVAPDPLRPLRDLLELLPEPLLLLDRAASTRHAAMRPISMRPISMRHANLAARESFGDILAALLRHPALADAAARVQGEAVVTTIVKMDVPVRRVLRASLKALPAAYPGLLVVSLSDHTQQAAMARMREDFIANASHELRTPLASLIGFIDTLIGPAADDPPAQRRFLAIMQTQAARMRRLIDSLMNLSRIELSEHERPRGHFALGRVAAHVAGEFEPLVRTRRIALDVDLAEDLPMLQGDGDQVAQIVQNLLDNALKHARSRIVLSAHPASGTAWPAAPGVVLTVADDGPGIAAHHLPRLTERFYRAEDGNTGRTGSGLGLAIVKHIVGRHAGRLLIESSVGEGSLFSVWLPCAGVTKLT
ncbi:sensor histidine kinase [Lichenicoccus sp.]|uniref:sensor histidine kinase n=1 Tax=Lichenicoccus sp. TaxID=2781899 RepID=UPI003D11732C